MSNRFFMAARVPSTLLAQRTAAMAMLASLLVPLAAAQQAPYPSKTIRLIASQAPGGGIDTLCRIVAPKLSDSVGQTVIVDNRPGANGSLRR
ncbi:MAG: hypothetical protein HY322_00950 [Betaproteobacteria bacterium]|nr:hypothetical protein [Betaproteobacteria bacterium]